MFSLIRLIIAITDDFVDEQEQIRQRRDITQDVRRVSKPQQESASSASKPVAGSVRKNPPPRADVDTTTVVKSARVGNSGTRNRVRIADFDAFTKDLLEDAISYYKADINTKNPFWNPSKIVTPQPAHSSKPAPTVTFKLNWRKII